MKHEAVTRFAQAMDEVLTKNDHKSGWGAGDCSIQYLRARLVEEMGEYFALVAVGETGTVAVRKELLDIANFAMMLWDRSSKEAQP